MQRIFGESAYSIRRQFFFFTFSLSLLCASLTKESGAEVWTDSTGTHSVTAEFLGLEGDIVALRGANGKRITIPLARLDAAKRAEIHFLPRLLHLIVNLEEIMHSRLMIPTGYSGHRI